MLSSDLYHHLNLCHAIDAAAASQEENVRRKVGQEKRKADGKDSGSDPAKKRRKKEWWEVEMQGRQPVEEDDDIQAYRDEVTPKNPDI